MFYRYLPLPVVARARPLDVVQYLRAVGWAQVEEALGDVGVYRRPEAEEMEVAVPLNPDFADFGRRMADAIATVAEFEKRQPMEILNELLLPPSDVLRFRFDDPAAESGTLPLDEGLRLLTGARKALRAVACSVMKPSRYFKTTRRNETAEFIQNCRLGQTERGSFTSVLICPMDAVQPKSTDAPGQTSLLLEDHRIPFTRQVTALLMRSLDYVVTCVTRADEEALLVTEGAGVGVSANLYEALVEMQPPSDRSNLEVTATWARGEPVPTTMASPRVGVRKEHFPVLSRAATRLRPRQKPREDRFVGKLDCLRGEPDEGGQMHGEVVLAFQWEDELLKAKMNLDASDYAIACDAHKKDHFVSARGTLNRGARMHEITEPGDFMDMDANMLLR